MRPTPCGCTSARFSGFTGTAVDAATPQPCLRRHTFSGLSEKVCKKRRWMRIGLYRGATEGARRRRLRPAHGNLSAKLNYSAACVEERSHREQLLRKGMEKHPAVEITTHLRIRRWCSIFAFYFKFL